MPTHTRLWDSVTRCVLIESNYGILFINLSISNQTTFGINDVNDVRWRRRKKCIYNLMEQTRANPYFEPHHWIELPVRPLRRYFPLESACFTRWANYVPLPFPFTFYQKVPILVQIARIYSSSLYNIRKYKL